MEPYPVLGRPQALTSSYSRKRLIYWEPDRALPQFSIPPELLNMSTQRINRASPYESPMGRTTDRPRNLALLIFPAIGTSHCSTSDVHPPGTVKPRKALVLISSATFGRLLSCLSLPLASQRCSVASLVSLFVSVTALCPAFFLPPFSSVTCSFKFPYLIAIIDGRDRAGLELLAG